MAYISQIVAGATQYDGTAGLGLVQFDLTGIAAPNIVPRIQYLALTVQGVAADIVISIGLVATAAANRAALITETGNSVVYPCPLTLGKATSTNIHEIYVTTANKTGQGLLEVIWFPYNALLG